MERLSGRVLWFANGIGFICPEGYREGENDIFFHFTQIIMPEEGTYKTIDAGAEVTFGIGKNHKGPMAVEIIEVRQDREDPDEGMLVQEQYAE